MLINKALLRPGTDKGDWGHPVMPKFLKGTYPPKMEGFTAH